MTCIVGRYKPNIYEISKVGVKYASERTTDIQDTKTEATQLQRVFIHTDTVSTVHDMNQYLIN